jgi:hypothetical protein
MIVTEVFGGIGVNPVYYLFLAPLETVWWGFTPMPPNTSAHIRTFSAKGSAEVRTKPTNYPTLISD